MHRMRIVRSDSPLSYLHLFRRNESSGRCVAQRIKISMIAGGNHTMI